MARKQSSFADLCSAQRMRKSDIQTCLLRVVGCLPSRQLLSRRNPWDEVARGELPYEPAEKLVLMLTDATRTAARHCTKAKQEEVRANVQALLATIERYVLEPLAEERDTDVIPLLLEDTKVNSRANEVQDLAKVNQSPEHLLAVARVADDEIRVSTRLKNACMRAATRGSRPSHLTVA